MVDNPKRRLEDRLPEGVEVAIQPEPNGTGGAVQAAATHIDPDSTVVILAGDVPLITAEALAALVKAHEDSDAQATMATMELDDPGQYGRVIRDETGNVTQVVEAKGGEGDATPEQLEIREVNTGIYAFDGQALLDALDKLRPDNAQGELYLPDVLPQLETIQAHLIADPTLTLGVNDRVQLARGAQAGATPHPRRPPARRREHPGPRQHAHRRRRADRPGHDHRAGHAP